MKAIEAQRMKGVIGSPLEAQVTLLVSDQGLEQLCASHRDTLAEAFVGSEVTVQRDGAAAVPGGSTIPGLIGVRVNRAPGKKCGRCWKHLPSVGTHPAHSTLCARCVQVVLGQHG